MHCNVVPVFECWHRVEMAIFVWNSVWLSSRSRLPHIFYLLTSVLSNTTIVGWRTWKKSCEHVLSVCISICCVDLCVIIPHFKSVMKSVEHLEVRTGQLDIRFLILRVLDNDRTLISHVVAISSPFGLKLSTLMAVLLLLYAYVRSAYNTVYRKCGSDALPW
jgi:hypothetical protein